MTMTDAQVRAVYRKWCGCSADEHSATEWNDIVTVVRLCLSGEIRLALDMMEEQDWYDEKVHAVTTMAQARKIASEFTVLAGGTNGDSKR